MSNVNKETDKDSNYQSGFKVMICIIASIAILVSIHSFIEYRTTMVDSGITEERKAVLAGILGTKGDYYGGLLNPMFGFLSLMALLYTIVLQSRELSLSRQELEATKEEVKRSADAQERSGQALDGQLALQAKQSFESTFFNLLELHNSLLKDLKVDLKLVGPLLDNNYLPPQVFVPPSHNVPSDWVEGNTLFSGREVFRELLEHLFEASSSPQDIARKYSSLNVLRNDLLGHYFRNLYQILKHIDKSGLSDMDKQRYSSILRAQLSSYELAMLFLNCIDENVDEGDFRLLLCTYKMLEHLPIISAAIDKSDALQILAHYTFADSKLVLADDRMLGQYSQPMTKNEDGIYSHGAFGTNPTIASIYSPSP